MKFSAIIFDLDGTAMPSAIDAIPGNELIEITQEYRQQIPLCAATGRSWVHAKPIIQALGLTKPCICSGGALIADPVTEEILWQATIPTATAQAIAGAASAFPFVVTYANGLAATERAMPSSITVTEPVNTLYILDVPFASEAAVLAALADIPDVTISKAHSWNVGVDLHITNKESTKEHAVGELCRLLSVDSKDVAGIGDGFNDLHLFQAVGYKVAMGNAVPELKAAADEVIGSQPDNGLGEFIKSSIA